MAQMLMAVFENPVHADQALEELEQKGYTPEEISVISKTNVYETGEKGGEKPVAKTAGTGAAAGGAIGGVAGLLAGVGTLPALAGLFVAGPLVAALGFAGVAATTAAGALTGAAAGGLIGALVGMGLPKEKAKTYDAIVERGGVVIGLSGHEDITNESRQILEKNGALDVSLIEVQEQQPAHEQAQSQSQAAQKEARHEQAMEEQRQQSESRGGTMRQEPAFGERRENKDES